MSATDSNVTDIFARTAEWLAQHPEAITNQMELHAGVVARLRSENATLKSENERLKARLRKYEPIHQHGATKR